MPRQAVSSLGHRLYTFWERFREDFRTTTRDGSGYAYHYLSGLLRMDTKRHFAGIGREVGISGQNLQHFMSESPWSGPAVCRRVQEELKATPELIAGGVLLIDESADEKAGAKSAGAGRQYNGRLGKVEMSQVAVLLSYLNGHFISLTPPWMKVRYRPEECLPKVAVRNGSSTPSST